MVPSQKRGKNQWQGQNIWSQAISIPHTPALMAGCLRLVFLSKLYSNI